MEKIIVEKATKDKLKKLNITSWNKWECQPSEFDWEYDNTETCYILEGRANVKSSSQEVEFKKDDIVIFPKGLKCKWQVIDKIRKVYKFG